jgi:hypothetical protein
MRRLTLLESLEIQEIFIQYFERREKPGEHLKALIKISQIQIDIAEQYFTINVRELIPDFYSKIIDEQQNLWLFLQVFESQLYQDSEERLKVKEYLEKLERSHPLKSTSKQTKINQLLEQERQVTPSHNSNTQQPIKIDNTIIVNYDLHELKSEFRLGYEGIFAFTIVGDDTILRNYIIKRILKELDKEERAYRPPIDIILSDTYGTIEEQIDSYLQNRNICDKIADLLNDNQYLDTLLIIWNYNLSQDKLSSIAHHFLNRIHQECCQYLENKSKCLIIILANVSTPCQLNGYTPLTVPQRFEIDDLSQWFYRCLIKHQIEEIVIEQKISRLKAHQGHLTATYRMLEQIITELQGREFFNDLVL